MSDTLLVIVVRKDDLRNPCVYELPNDNGDAYVKVSNIDILSLDVNRLEGGQYEVSGTEVYTPRS